MKIIEALKKAIEELEKNNIKESKNKARIILANCLKIPKERILVEQYEEIEDNIKEEYFQKIIQLINNRPIQYIIRKSGIYEIKFLCR